MSATILLAWSFSTLNDRSYTRILLLSIALSLVIKSAPFSTVSTSHISLDQNYNEKYDSENIKLRTSSIFRIHKKVGLKPNAITRRGYSKTQLGAIQRSNEFRERDELNRELDAMSKTESAQKADDMLHEALKLSENENIGGGLLKPDTTSFNTVIDLWAKSGEKSAPLKAEALLHRMEEMWTGGDDYVAPNIISYNSVINAWAKSGTRGSAKRAEAVLKRMQDLCHDVEPDAENMTGIVDTSAKNDEKGSTLIAEHAMTRKRDTYDVRPDTISYNTVIEAWAKSGEKGAAQKAEVILKQMQKLHDDGSLIVKPDTISFNAVINAWAKSGTKGSAQRAEYMLQQMQTRYDAGETEVEPNTISFTTVINAWATSGEKGSAQRAEAILQHMQILYEAGNTSLRPDTICFTAVIDAWAKSNEDGAAERAEEILQTMLQLYEAGNLDVRPNVRSYTAVINAWAKSGEAGAARRAENILQSMQKMYKTGYRDVVPDTPVFTAVINTWAKSKDRGKAKKVFDILCQMEDMYEDGNKNVKPDVILYTSVMNACAFTVGPKEDKMYALKVLIKVMEDLENSPFCKPNSFSYATFLKACANLMPRSENRNAIVDDFFNRCCQAGYVNSFVLHNLLVASPLVYRKRLGEASEQREIRLNDLPLEWSRHVRGRQPKHYQILRTNV
mmetsp:Transcript_19378/g.28472  ORF Transcript_19378/g.28472 Transcript_19378/m.28472 type:complete len:674 (+) Transcript_19378:61-2082(+)